MLVMFKQYETFISIPCIREFNFKAQGAFCLPAIKATIHRSNIAKSYIYMRTFFIFAIHGANRPCKPRRLKHGKTAADFQHSQPMAAHIAKRSPRKLILSIFSPWPHIRPKVAPGSSFWGFSNPGRTYGQKWTQEAHLEHFQPLAANIAKSNTRQLIFAIFSSWPHISPKVVPGSQ